MANQKRNVKIVFRPGRPLTKVVLLITIILCTVALVTIRSVLQDEQQRLETGKAAAFAQEQKRDEFQNKIDKLGSQDSIQDIAGEELGLYPPDTTIVETE